MEVLKVKIFQPEAHYRVPFSYQRRFTYPIPPFSTIKGLICNLLNIKNDNNNNFKALKDGLFLSIFGKYESLIKEYIWFRNLSKQSHINRFRIPTNRIIDNVPEHPGGQSPIHIDVLNNVELIIYIYIDKPDILNSICEAFKLLGDKNTTIHLGRAEDWLVINEVKMTTTIEGKTWYIPYFTWIPSGEHNSNYRIEKEEYEKFYNSLRGNVFKLPTFYEIDNYQRIFNQYVSVKLFEGGTFKSIDLHMDKEENLPVILTKLFVNCQELK